MANTVHVFDFLAAARHAPVNILFGDEPFLKRLARRSLLDQVLGDHREWPATTFAGTEIAWKDALDELSTVSLFGAGEPRLVMIEDADTFVTKYRDRLEAYAEKPKQNSTLLLDVSTWQKTTRLYKLLDKAGLQIDCRPPTKSGSSKAIDEKRILQWLSAWSAETHERRLPAAAAARLLEIVGPNFGLLDQELAKLALVSEKKGGVTVDLVQSSVGGWRAQSTWELVDAATDGDSHLALQQLDRLLLSGEHPVGLLAQISWSLRRFATATRIYEQEERQRRRPKLGDALIQAGFPHWNRQALARAEKQLKQLGRARASKLHRWLLDADLALKGSHSTPQQARLVLELLIVRIGRRDATTKP